MAWLEQLSNGRYHVAFRYAGQKLKKSLHTTDSNDAKARLHRLEENIRLVESGRLALPEDADVATFLLLEGSQLWQTMGTAVQLAVRQKKRGNIGIFR